MERCIFPRTGIKKCPKSTCCSVMNCTCCLDCRDRKRCQSRCPHITEKLSDLAKAEKRNV